MTLREGFYLIELISVFAKQKLVTKAKIQKTQPTFDSVENGMLATCFIIYRSSKL